jgi:hypothetical protein
MASAAAEVRLPSANCPRSSSLLSSVMSSMPAPTLSLPRPQPTPLAPLLPLLQLLVSSSPADAAVLLDELLLDANITSNRLALSCER